MLMFASCLCGLKGLRLLHRFATLPFLVWIAFFVQAQSFTAFSAQTAIRPNIVLILADDQGYADGMVGKWHLGTPPEFLATSRGFDDFLGLPYSNDEWPFHPEKPGLFPPLPLLDGTRVVKPGITQDDMNLLTRWYTERALKF